MSFKDEGERSRGVRRTRGPAPGAAGWTWGLCGGTAAHCSQGTQSEQGGPLYGELQTAMGVLETISQQCGGLSHLPSVTMENAGINSVNESDRLGRNVTGLAKGSYPEGGPSSALCWQGLALRPWKPEEAGPA